MYFFKNVDITNIFSSFGETEKPEKKEDKQKDGKTPCIDPKVVHTSRRMVLYKEVDRLASNATKFFVSII